MKIIILFCFAFMHQLSIIQCFDIKMETKLKNDYEKHLIRQLSEGISREIQQYSIKKDFPNKKINISRIKTNNEIPVEDDKKMDITLKLYRSLLTFSDTNDTTVVFDLESQISKKGCIKLKYFLAQLKDYLNPYIETNEMLHNVTKDYIAELNTYFNFLGRQQVKCRLEREFYFLDIIESSNEIFISKSKIIFNYIMAQMNNSMPEIDVKILTNELHKTGVNEKKENLNYICTKLEICRLYPAYMDYVAKILGEILILSDSKVNIIVNVLKDIVGNRVPFFKTIMDDDIAFNIGVTLNTLTKNVTDIRNFISVLRQIIQQRNYIFRSEGKEINLKQKAVRMLCDIIDKTFEVLGEETLENKFSDFVKVLKAWALEESYDVQTIVTKYCKLVHDILQICWTPETKDEVKVLIRVILTGTAEVNVHNELFTEGSKFMIRKSAHSYLDKFFPFI